MTYHPDLFDDFAEECLDDLDMLLRNRDHRRAHRGTYYVRTWDSERMEYTPQAGIKAGPYSQFGLRRAIRKLRDMGYEAYRDDSSVLIERVGDAKIKKPRKRKDRR
jgi:hypothetical protein